LKAVVFIGHGFFIGNLFHFCLHRNQPHIILSAKTCCMERPLFEPSVTRKLYNERSVLIGTFIGGPLVAGYLIAQNFKALEQPGNANKTWLLTAFVFVFLFVSDFIPGLADVPAIAYSALFCILAHSAARKFQGSQIALHQTSGGRLYSTSRAALIGIISLLITLALFFGLLYLAEAGAA
jgi:hypothetical protein